MTSAEEGLASPDLANTDSVRRIADLARLRVSDDEAAGLARDFASILAYLGRLSAVDTDGVEPLAHAPPQMLREDVPVSGLDRADILASAPDPTDDGSFAVPRVLGTCRSNRRGAGGRA